MQSHTSIRIAYIGGGSKGWAGSLMNDLARASDLGGEVILYDIDKIAASRNALFGNWLQAREGVASRFKYRTASSLKDALCKADFVICSITPGPLSLMASDISLPEQYGCLHTVGDTVGPAGTIRAMRAIPMYETIAHAVAQYCPKAWIINYTNPMTVLTRTLTFVEPDLKAFGCCHEVFGTQGFLASLAADQFNVRKIPRREIELEVAGINHFTWVSRATWKGHDLLSLLKKKLQSRGFRKTYSKKEMDAELRKAGGAGWLVNHHEVTFELFERYSVLPAAGDRHLAEFVPGFLRNKQEIARWGIAQTSVAFRQQELKNRIKRDKKRMSNPNYKPEASGEEGVDQMRALLGLQNLRTNVNLANQGQMPDLPKSAVVETNALFSNNTVRPLKTAPLSKGVLGLVLPHVLNQELLVSGAVKRDLNLCFQAFLNDPTLTLPPDKAHELFEKMVKATRTCLKGYR